MVDATSGDCSISRPTVSGICGAGKDSCDRYSDFHSLDHDAHIQHNKDDADGVKKTNSVVFNTFIWMQVCLPKPSMAENSTAQHAWFYLITGLAAHDCQYYFNLKSGGLA